MTSLTAAFLLTTSFLSTPIVPPGQPVPQAAALVAAGVDVSSGPRADQPKPARVLRVDQPGRPKALMPLYAGFAALQGYDLYSTTKALAGGAVEANPVMRSVVNNPLLFISIKGGITLSSIYAAERLWRQGHRKAAVVVMAVVGGIMAVTAANNARVLRQIR